MIVLFGSVYTFLVVSIIIYAILAIPVYVMTGTAFFRLGKVMGHKYPGIAWIPFLNTFLVAYVAGKRHKPLGLAYIILSGINLACFIAVIIVNATQPPITDMASLQAASEPSSVITFIDIVNFIASNTGNLIGAALYSAVYKIYNPQKAKAYAIVTWVFAGITVLGNIITGYWPLPVLAMILSIVVLSFIYNLSIQPYKDYQCRRFGRMEAATRS